MPLENLSSNPLEILLYIKQDCHLCADMLTKMDEFIIKNHKNLAVSITLRDIDDNPVWYEAYREYVPVLIVNGEEICHYFFNGEELESAIKHTIKHKGIQ